MWLNIVRSNAIIRCCEGLQAGSAYNAQDSKVAPFIFLTEYSAHSCCEGPEAGNASNAYD